MLVLSRKVGERIIVPGCELTIAVLEVRRNQVRLGITAPPEVAVYRTEILGRMEDKAAAPPNNLPSG
jgi:carbon storage regulator